MISRFLSLVVLVAMISETILAATPPSLPKTMAPRHTPKKKTGTDFYVGSPARSTFMPSESKKIQLKALEKLTQNPDALNSVEQKSLVQGESPLNETHLHALYLMDPLVAGNDTF